MLDRILIGAVTGAIREVVPQVERQVLQSVAQAHETPPFQPLPRTVTAPLNEDELVARIVDRLRDQPEFQQIQAATAPVPWYRSHVVVGGIIALLTPILAGAEIQLGPEDNTAIVGLIGGLGSAIAGAVVLYGRIFKGAAQPVTLTKKA